MIECYQLGDIVVVSWAADVMSQILGRAEPEAPRAASP
jgi:hypothetical protein